MFCIQKVSRLSLWHLQLGQILACGTGKDTVGIVSAEQMWEAHGSSDVVGL